MVGTFINVSTVLLGGTTGALIGERLPDRFKQTVMHAIGLMTLLIGFQMALGTRSAIVVLGSVALGGLLGETARIDDGLTALGQWVESRVGSRNAKCEVRSAETPAKSSALRTAHYALPMGGANPARVGDGEAGSLFSKGFVTASLVFCVGPMTILGSFQDGLTGVYDTLAVKSVLDGFTAVALASSLGWGVVLSSIIVLVFQGALTLGAVWVKPFLSEPIVTEMTATGGLLIVGIGMNILGILKVRVANLLPALVIAPILMWLLGGGW